MSTGKEAKVVVLGIAMQLIEETVAECEPNGAPSGPICAALASMGMSYDVYQRLLAALVKGKYIRVTSDNLIFLDERSQYYKK